MTWSDDSPDRRNGGESVTWKAYVDAIFEEHRVQVETALASHDIRVASNKESVSDRLAALNETTTRLMEAGDSALLQHIDAQKVQAASEMASVDRRLVDLHQEMVLRDTGVRDLLVAETNGGNVRVREAFAASEKAIEKAENASEKRFDAVNAFREQLAEQSNQFLPREVADAQFAELRKLIQRNTERLDLDQGSNQGQAASSSQIFLIVGLMISIAAILIGAFT